MKAKVHTFIRLVKKPRTDITTNMPMNSRDIYYRRNKKKCQKRQVNRNHNFFSFLRKKRPINEKFIEINLHYLYV